MTTLSFGTSLDPVSSRLARLAVNPLRNHAGSNRSSKWSPLGVSDLTCPYSATSCGPQGLTAEEAADEDGRDAANTRDDAKTVAARSTAAVTHMSAAFFMSTP